MTKKIPNISRVIFIFELPSVHSIKLYMNTNVIIDKHLYYAITTFEQLHLQKLTITCISDNEYYFKHILVF